MNKLKLIVTLMLTFTVLLAQVGHAAAAPQLQKSILTGTIQSISTQTDSTVLVVLKDKQGVTHNVSLSVADAKSIGLISVDSGTGAIIFLMTSGTTVDIPTADIIPDTTTQESVNPISALLASFFGEDASVIDSWHSDGTGFGVIAQALWISKNLNGDATLAGQILEAKQTGDYSAFFSVDATNIPTNWGQFKKELLQKKNNLDEKNNLGNVVSGHATDDDSSQPGHGNGNGNGQGNGNGNGNGQGNGNGHNKP